MLRRGPEAALDAGVDAADPPDADSFVQIAPDRRAACKACGAKIDKGAMRCVFPYKTKWGQTKHYYHARCVGFSASSLKLLSKATGDRHEAAPSLSRAKPAPLKRPTAKVEAVLEARTTAHGGREYLVKWEGLGLHECTWEPAAFLLESASELVAEHDSKLVALPGSAGV
jgi:hypothetical protein